MATSNRNYNVPSEGDTNWHIPVNENWNDIDTDVQSSLDMGDGDVVVVERGTDDYAAIEYDGTVVDSGTNGMVVLQSGIDAAASGGVIRVRGSYSYSDTSNALNLDSDKHLVGHEATITNSTGLTTAPISVNTGTETTTVTNLNTDASPGEIEIDVVDASSFSKGDLIRLLSGDFHSSRNAQQESEMHLVESVDTTNDIVWVSTPLHLSYSSANTSIDKIAPETAKIEGFTIEGSGTESDERGIYVRYAKDVVIEDVTLRNLGYRLVDIVESYGCVVRNSLLEDCDQPGDGYGVRVRSGCGNTRIVDNTIRLCRHCVSHSDESDKGMTYGTLIEGNTLTGTTEGAVLDSHDGTISWHIINNQMYAYDTTAIQNGAKECVAEGNVVKGISASDNSTTGSLYRTEGDHSWSNATVKLTDNYIGLSADPAFHFLGGHADLSFKSLVIKNNHVDEPLSFVARLEPNIDSLVFDGNTVEGKEESGLQIFQFRSPCNIDSASISNNNFSRVERQFMWNVDANVIANLTVSDNTFYDTPVDTGRDLINISGVDDSVFEGNTIMDPNGRIDGYAFNVLDDSNRILIKDNNIRHDGSVNLLLDNGTDTMFEDNYQDDGSQWIKIDDHQYFTDFSEYSDGTDLTTEDWSYNLDADTGVTWDKQTINGEDAADLQRPAETDRDAITWDVINDTSGEVEVFATWRYTDSTVDMRPTLFLHGSGTDSASANGIRFQCDAQGDTIGISEYNSGTWGGDLDTGSVTFTEGNYYSMRAWTDGSSATFKVWDDSGNEVETAQASTSSITISSGDFNGIFEWQDTDPVDYEYTRFGAGINGAPAPKK